MMCFFSALLILLAIFTGIDPAIAGDFEAYMQEWDQKRELATQHLLDAEKALKAGDKLNGCLQQRRASKYGIEATESLIKAMKLNGSMDEFENFESGLNKWRELGDFCK